MEVTRSYERLQEVTKGCINLKEPPQKYSQPAYESLKFYQDLCELRILIYQITEKFKPIHIRLVSQMRDAARSAKQNIREGYRRGSVGEFARGIKISQASLEELLGDLEDCKADGLMSPEEFERANQLGRSARYLSDRYLMSLYQMEKESTWKMPGGRLRRKRNL